MTLREFALFQKGFSQKVDREMHQLAWVTAHLLNAWKGKKGAAITIAKLLPKSQAAKAQANAPTSWEEAKARARAKRDEAQQQELWGSEKGERVKELLELEG